MKPAHVTSRFSKFGKNFLGMEKLPHTSAVITNLADELPLVDRMQDALNGEMNRRQELLRRRRPKQLGRPRSPLRPTL